MATKRTGRWIYSMSGEGMPADAETDYGSRDEAIAAAQAEYWPPEDREALKKRDPQYRLAFHVGKVMPAMLKPIPAEEILAALAEAQPQNADAPPDWLDVEGPVMTDLKNRVHAVVVAWVQEKKKIPNWDMVAWERVEVPV